MKRIVVCLSILMLTACAAPPVMKEPPPDFPRDSVMFQLGYPAAFDKIVQSLEARGYEIAIADRRAGIIQTHPKKMELGADASSIEYKGLYMIRLDGDSTRSWGVIRFALLPEAPEEREKLIRELQGEGAPSP